MSDYKTERLSQALELAFDHLSDHDDFAGVSLTGLELSPDRKHVTVYWVGPEGVDEAVLSQAFDRIRFDFENEAEEVLRRRARVRFVMDKGAVNKRRVEAILDELGGDPEPDAKE